MGEGGALWMSDVEMSGNVGVVWVWWTKTPICKVCEKTVGCVDFSQISCSDPPWLPWRQTFDNSVELGKIRGLYVYK